MVRELTCMQYICTALLILYVCTGVPEHAQSPNKGHFSSAIPHDIHMNTNRVRAEISCLLLCPSIISIAYFK